MSESGSISLEESAVLMPTRCLAPTAALVLRTLALRCRAGVSESLEMTITSSAVADPAGRAVMWSGFIWARKRGLAGEGDGALAPEASGDRLPGETCFGDLRGDFLRRARVPLGEDGDEDGMDTVECLRVRVGMDIGKGRNVGTALEMEEPSVPSSTAGCVFTKTLGPAGAEATRKGSASSRRVEPESEIEVVDVEDFLVRGRLPSALTSTFLTTVDASSLSPASARRTFDDLAFLALDVAGAFLTAGR